MRKYQKSTPRSLSLLIAALAVSFSGYAAEGLRLLPDSAEALGKVGGNKAKLNDASAVPVNPSNLDLIEGTEVMVTTTLLHGTSYNYY